MDGTASQIDELLRTARGLHQAGNNPQAGRLLRQLLDLQPHNPDAIHLFGVIAFQCGKNQQAVELIGNAVLQKPEKPEFLNDLGAAQNALGNLAQAADCCRRALEIRPDYAAAHNNLGLVLLNQSRAAEAVGCFERALRITPRNMVALNNLVNAWRAQGALGEAVTCYQRALEIDPQNAGTHIKLGQVLCEQEKLDEAMACHRRALQIDPMAVAAHVALGTVLKKQDNTKDAIECFRIALAIDPSCAAAHTKLGAALQQEGNLEEGLEHCRRAIALDPNSAAAHNELGNILQIQGRIDEATDCFQKAIALNPTRFGAYQNLAHARRYAEADLDQAEVRQVEKRLAEENLIPQEQCNLHFALGKVYDDCRQWDRAFAHFSEANRLANRHFEEHPFVEKVNDLIQVCTKTLLASKAGIGHRSEVPIFIVGMPRSGTTLVEQILSSHPAVAAAGERDAMPKIAQAIISTVKPDLTYPHGMANLDRHTACELGEIYVGWICELIGGEAEMAGVTRITDKMPFNFLNLALIALILPKAKIIHCRRHPLDVCLSCYFHNFSKRLDFTYDLHSVGLYYGHYDRLMEHWRTVLPVPVFQLDYQRLVENQEQVSRALVDFCGLEWDPNCLQFHENPRSVKTASNWQVRQPIYTSSVARWRHYEEFLGPLKESLRESLRRWEVDR